MKAYDPKALVAVSLSKLDGVADTLYLPLAARIYVSKRFPDYFHDEKALSLEKDMPYDEIVSKSSEYFEMAGACRFHYTDQMIREFIAEYRKCNVINLGCGLETAYYRIHPEKDVTFYEMDLPDVIEARRRVLGESANEVLIGGDMFNLRWADDIDTSLPTMITAIGVFQYFDEVRITGLLQAIKSRFPHGEVLFDAMTMKALKYANDYVKKTGNTGAMMGFGVDDGPAFAQENGFELIRQQPFFTDARKQLRKQLKLYTRIAMKVVDEGGRRGFLLLFGW